jgi:ABC-type nitrate/sulfonate/bicarbonate transport system permease component
VLFSPPLAVFRKAGELALSGVLFEHIRVSLQRIPLGFALARHPGSPLGS